LEAVSAPAGQAGRFFFARRRPKNRSPRLCGTAQSGMIAKKVFSEASFMRSMSDLSLAEWNRLREQALSPADAVARLYADFPARTFAETLGSLCAEPDLRDALTRIVEGEGASPASADRTVRNWLGGKSVPDDREMLYALAFGLHLSVEGANRLLCAVSDYGIHARDPAEVVYLFALGAGMPFAEAKALRRRCEAMRGESEGTRVATRLLQGQVARLRTGEEFVRWYQDHLDEFSTLHGAAYGYFTEYLNALLGGGEDFSLEYVADTCLRFQDAVPLQRSLRHMDAMQRLLRRYWPSATTSSR
jgi:hypothetical protein